MPKALTQEEFLNRLNSYTNNTVELITPYVNRRTKVTIQCKKCGHQWQISPSSIIPSQRQNYSFIGCSECKYEEVECSYCHKKFKRLKSQLEKDNKTGFIYCSRECGNKHKNEQVTIWSNGTGYRRNAFNKYEHKCAVCGWDEDERILEVHHIDEDRSHNDINNLIILCPICHKKLTLHLYTLEELLEK